MIHPISATYGRSIPFLLLWVLFLSGCLYTRGQKYRDFTVVKPLERGETLILGFLGGRDSWKDPTPGVARLASKLRSMDLPGVQVQVVENKKRSLAVQLVQNAFDSDLDGILNFEEKSTVRLIVFGQSFGGAAVVKFAKDLHPLGISILLTVQVDSVGRHDRIIPPNVRRAANLFQKNGIFIRGEPEIVAEDDSATEILGNHEFDYSQKDIDLSGVPWYKKIFRVAHAKMDRDPGVWETVETLILQELER